jgi:hypothetical protein
MVSATVVAARSLLRMVVAASHRENQRAAVQTRREICALTARSCGWLCPGIRLIRYRISAGGGGSNGGDIPDEW